MSLRSVNVMAFNMPGGEGSVAVAARPIDLAHLSRQTLGDRAVEHEVLGLFIQQALLVRDRLPKANSKERLQLAHSLKGAAKGVGAFPIAACLEDIERDPENQRHIRRLGTLIASVRDFICAISR